MFGFVSKQYYPRVISIKYIKKYNTSKKGIPMMRSLLVLPQVFPGDDESLDLSRAFIDLKK